MNNPFFVSVLAMVLLAGARRESQAAILSNVPMQGSMVMPMVRYDAAGQRLQVTVDPAIPELIPLLVSHPGDSFDPADPWHEFLDPARQGLAFSRRYGFVMDANTDALPSGASIAIRKISSPPGLNLYRYRSTAPKAWEPIFGTGASADVFRWDGMMFHPAVTAPPGTNRYSAIFEAILVESDSGRELSGTGTGPFEMSWTSVSDGRPVLEIATQVVISCPTAAGWVLEATAQLAPADWFTLTNSPVLLEGRSAFVLDPSPARRFFRMKQLP